MGLRLPAAERRTTPRTHDVDLNDIPKIPADRIRYLWHLGYYDGPISGMATVDGEPCYFDQFFESNAARHRIYVLYKLTKEQFEIEQRRHALFQEHVGAHTDYTYVDDKPRRRLKDNQVRPQGGWDKFYKAEHEPWDISAAPAIGWFSDADIYKSKGGESAEKCALDASREIAIRRKVESNNQLSSDEARFLIEKIKQLRKRNHEIAMVGQKQLAEERERFYSDAAWYRLARDHANKFIEEHATDKQFKSSENDRTEVKAALQLYYEAAIENYELRHGKKSGFFGFFKRKETA